MKKIYLVILSVLAFGACQKGGVFAGNGCIDKIVKQSFNIKPADSITAIHLLQQNNIQYNNLVFTSIILNDTITNTEGTHIYQHIAAIQYINGLPVLSDGFAYHFKDGIYYTTSGKVYSSVSLDNRSQLTLSKLRDLYMTETVDKGGFNPTYRDSCVVAQFGYFNLNAGTGNTTVNMVKAWRIHLKTQDYPVATFRDDNGQLIYFDSGIRTFEAKR